MKVVQFDGYSLYSRVDINTRDCVIALGVFDGVHIAHCELLKTAILLQKKLGARYAGAWSFERIGSVPHITTKMKRVELILDQGMDFVVLADFSKFKGIPPADFIGDHLKGEIGCVGAVCGFNFRFGKDRLGSPADLAAAFGESATAVVSEVTRDGVTVSSTVIRRLIADGDTERAASLLGRPFSLCTEVQTGKQLGRTIGFPTANQFFGEGSVVPKSGIYATLCTVDGERFIGVTNVGVRPSIIDGTDDHALNLETYICDFEGDIYGKTMCVEFYKRLRDERSFESLDGLREAISHDVDSARSYFKERADV